MNNWMKRYLEQEQGTVETEFDMDMVDALEDDGLVGVIESDMGYGDSWYITAAGRAALAAPEPPLPATDDDIVCEGCGQRKPDSTFTESGGLHLCADCTSDAGSAAYIEMLRGYAEAAEERAREAERKLAAEREAHRALVKAAEELTRAALAVHDNVWQPRDSDWLRVDDDSVVDMARAADNCRDALAALEGEDDRD